MSIKPIYMKLFKSYNLAIQEKCEASLGTVRSFDDFDRLINEARKAWEESDLDGKKPVEYFRALETKEELSDAFDIAAVTCDEFVPDSFVSRILETGHMDIVEKHAFGNSDIDMKNSALKVLGISGDSSYVEGLMNLMYDEGEYSELIKETARQALIDIGEPALPKIEERLSGLDILQDDDFHLVIALIGIDSDKKNDAVYSLLKESFRKTSDKALAARCLADYGDGRAVPMLRSYLERNLVKLDENTVFELQGAVLKLGGSTSGMDIPDKG